MLISWMVVIIALTFSDFKYLVKLRNNCMLISWMVVTIALSAKYIWVVVTHDWSALEVKT